jgi:hypothetical protein
MVGDVKMFCNFEDGKKRNILKYKYTTETEKLYE